MYFILNIILENTYNKRKFVILDIFLNVEKL